MLDCYKKQKFLRFEENFKQKLMPAIAKKKELVIKILQL